jgi:hypothetical protein
MGGVRVGPLIWTHAFFVSRKTQRPFEDYGNYVTLAATVSP